MTPSTTHIIPYLRSGHPALYVVSPEERRVEAEFKAIAATINRRLLYWSAIDGLVDTTDGRQTQALDPLEALQAIGDGPKQAIILLRDFHLHLVDPLPMLLAKLKEVLQLAKTREQTLVIVGCRLVLPPQIEREITLVEFPLPGKEQLSTVLDHILDSAALAQILGDDRDRVLSSSLGFTTIEAENAFALSVVESRTIDPTIVAREKARAVKKNGLLEVVETGESLESIGGLDLLKAWLLKRRNAFGQRAKEYHLPMPKGLLIIGIPGTGKSLAAKATAKVFGVPLLKLDAGRIFGGLVGQSEANLRAVIQTAEAIAPCCLWIDELEKGFSGSKSSGSTDGGTSARVFGSFITWMQEKNAPVFVVATANDVTQLPPELLRKGRWDELFFVDLPNETERQAIWRIVVAHYTRNPDEFDTAQLAKATDGLTGSEIEQAFIEALHCAFAQEKEPTDLTVASVLNDLVPLSKLMAEQIAGLRSWSKGRARPATLVNPERRVRSIG